MVTLVSELRSLRPPERTSDGAPVVDLSPSAIARIAKALGHPERVRILQQFDTGNPHIAMDISGESTLAQSTVSEHLRILREAGLLSARREGSHIWYSINRGILGAFVDAVDDLALDHHVPAYLAGLR